MAAIESPGRRKTYFLLAPPNRAATGANVPKSRPFPEENGEQKTTIESVRRKPDLLRPDKRTHSFNLPVFYEGPWTNYEKGIEIFPKRHTYLCRHRRDREDLVHIQQLKAGTATEALINTIIQGIWYLRYSSRALGYLTYDTIFLTSSGSVKVGMCCSSFRC
ncbi:unnamed protein product [Penicillium pancosmium]